MRITPLDDWIFSITGSRDAGSLREYQLAKVRETLRYVKRNSRFYREHLADIEPDRIKGLDDISRIPFTTPEMLAADPLGFVCVSAGDVGRIVTLPTSGTLGLPKRVFFTPGDQELAIDFFHRGMMTLACEGDRALIFLPGGAEGSVGDLLKRALARFGCEGIIHGPLDDYDSALRAFESSGANCAVGLPAQLFALSRLNPDIRLKSVLLCSDYVSDAVRNALAETWGCEVYCHYGMTETGLGGGVECSSHTGYHMREADLLFEIVDGTSGVPIGSGVTGELVFTTLTRCGMPLIRYRTGDMSSIIQEPCPCGSALRRLGKVQGRIEESITINEAELSMPLLDDILFSIPGIIGFKAKVAPGAGAGTLVISVYAPGNEAALRTADERLRASAFMNAPGIAGLINIQLIQSGVEVLTYGNTKRAINRCSSRSAGVRPKTSA